MNNIVFSEELDNLFQEILDDYNKRRLEFLTPECLLIELMTLSEIMLALGAFKVSLKDLHKSLDKIIKTIPVVPKSVRKYELLSSHFLEILIKEAEETARDDDSTVIETEHLIAAIFKVPECDACKLLNEALIKADDSYLLEYTQRQLVNAIAENRTVKREVFDRFSRTFGYDNHDDYDDEDFQSFNDTNENEEKWEDYAINLRDQLKNQNPLIGRSDEIDRIMQVLCRKSKNNILLLGDPGVGKTAIIYGLEKLLVDNNVPLRLKGYQIYQINMGDMVAGTQYRGDFEKRIKMVMSGLCKIGKAIVYLDDFHNIIGTGTTRDNGIGASDILRQYFENSNVRFIGTTSFAEYKRTLANSRSIMRHFQQIEVLEPSVDDTIKIILKLRPSYERFHSVKYPKDVIEFAVKASARYIHDRALPDKAIDLIDEAGAYHETHHCENQKVSKETVSKLLAKICKVDHISDINDESNDDKILGTLYQRICSKIYGQEAAVKQVTQAVLMARAGLLDEGKPMASLLFVGPTGVGKTEVSKVLAKELGLALVRFDMSEYSEKHTVAKLIGSPAGYVGYEDGGLLTDAIRKTPNCVLLLDEIEKAHSDIYNLLLQVMDYASLTDNRGTKVDFRHVILIMTSNAGAQHSGKANVGFTGDTSRGSNMMKAVKSTFKPEFLNRLSGTVVFNDMDKNMETLILQKKLDELQDRIAVRKISFQLSKEATDWLLHKGFTNEYGARELDRVINQSLKPLLMQEILFGALKKGGKATIDCIANSLTITVADSRTAKKKAIQ